MLEREKEPHMKCTKKKKKVKIVPFVVSALGQNPELW